MRLFLISASVAGLIISAGHSLATVVSPHEAVIGLVVAVDAGGGVRATGQMPREFPLADLKKQIPEIDLSGGVVNDGNGDTENWVRAIDALTIVLPRLHEGDARIAGRRVVISGILRPGFNAEATRGAIRLALGSAWEVEFALEEAPPPAALVLEKTAHGIVISGILPTGIDPPGALALLASEQDGGLTSGGGGDAAAWGKALANLGELVALYADATCRISDGAVEIEGTLLPGYEADRLGEWLGLQLGDGWQLSFSGQENPAREGDTRRDLDSGGTERLRRGRWLPELAFEPGPAACASQASSARAGGQVTFVIGKSQIEPAARPLLDRLAGVAIRCLNEGGLKLEFGGHTDNMGDDADNIALSQKRAMAVLLELIDRGVRADAMSAIGFGESRPVADNGTEDGRSTNRRITLEWSE